MFTHPAISVLEIRRERALGLNKNGHFIRILKIKIYLLGLMFATLKPKRELFGVIITSHLWVIFFLRA